MERLECCVSVAAIYTYINMEQGEKKQAAFDIRRTKQMFRNIYYSKGDLNEHTQPMKQVSLDEATMK
jgi:hypothetical protein